MSLEGDLLLPPRGPLKWRWLTAMLTKLGRAAALLSPDQSIAVKPSLNELVLTRRNQAPETNPAYNPWRVIKTGSSLYHVDGGEIKVNGTNKFPADADLTIQPRDTRLVVVKVSLDLTASGDAVTPRFNGTFSGAELTVVGTPTIETITFEQLENARSVLPGVRSEGVIYVPLAIVSYGNVEQVWLKKLSRIRVDLRHCDFKISAY